MDVAYLGHSGLRVSRLCLGTMTMDGTTCTEATSHAVLDACAFFATISATPPGAPRAFDTQQV